MSVENNFTYTHTQARNLWGNTSFEFTDIDNITHTIPVYWETEPIILIPEGNNKYSFDNLTYLDSRENEWKDGNYAIIMTLQRFFVLGTYYNETSQRYEPLPIRNVNSNITRLQTAMKTFTESLTGKSLYSTSALYTQTNIYKGVEGTGNFIKPDTNILNPNNITNYPIGFTPYTQNASQTLTHWVGQNEQLGLYNNLIGIYADVAGYDFTVYSDFTGAEATPDKIVRLGAPVFFEPVDYVKRSVEFRYNLTTQPVDRCFPNICFTRVYFGIQGFTV